MAKPDGLSRIAVLVRVTVLRRQQHSAIADTGQEMHPPIDNWNKGWTP